MAGRNRVIENEEVLVEASTEGGAQCFELHVSCTVYWKNRSGIVNIFLIDLSSITVNKQQNPDDILEGLVKYLLQHPVRTTTDQHKQNVQYPFL